ncbi:MAG: glutathione ABC transporter permease GsiC, partial [Planctomycetota bacterium]
MYRFILRRLGHSLIVLFIVSVIVCYMMRLIPGDPILIILGDEYDPEIYEEMRRELVFDKPIVMQYFYWMANILRGDFGYSYQSKKKVRTLLKQALPPTLALVTGT